MLIESFQDLTGVLSLGLMARVFGFKVRALGYRSCDDSYTTPPPLHSPCHLGRGRGGWVDGPGRIPQERVDARKITPQISRGG